MGKPRITASLDDDVYDRVAERSNTTGDSKSEVLNNLAREALFGTGGEQPTGQSFYQTLGEGLFIAGPVVALLEWMTPGIGLMFFGLGLMLFGAMQTHVKHGASYGEALKQTLGVA